MQQLKASPAELLGWSLRQPSTQNEVAASAGGFSSAAGCPMHMMAFAKAWHQF